MPPLKPGKLLPRLRSRERGRSDRIEIRKDAKLVGDIKTARIIIEDGAYFKGSIDIVRPEAEGGARPRAAAATRGPTGPGRRALSSRGEAVIKTRAGSCFRKD